MEFFAFIKEKLHEELPLYLRNILKCSGYDNRLAIANITEQEINQIENFSKTQLKDILSKRSNVNYETFYDLYSASIEDFIIAPGHKKLLLAIGEMCAEENSKLKLKDSFFNEDFNAKRRKIYNSPMPNSSEDLGSEAGEVVNMEKIGDNINLHDDQSRYVYDICYQWIKKFSETLSEADQNKVIETLHRLDIKILPSSVEDSLYFAYIKCSICKVEIKTQKRVKREGNTTWLISNFYKHFKGHFLDKASITDKKIGNVLKAQGSKTSLFIYEEDKNDSLTFEDYMDGGVNFKQEV